MTASNAESCQGGLINFWETLVTSTPPIAVTRRHKNGRRWSTRHGGINAPPQGILNRRQPKKKPAIVFINCLWQRNKCLTKTRVITLCREFRSLDRRRRRRILIRKPEVAKVAKDGNVGVPLKHSHGSDAVRGFKRRSQLKRHNSSLVWRYFSRSLRRK